MKLTKTDIRKVAEDLMKSEGCTYTFGFNRRLKSYGTCHYGKKRIFLSEYFLHRPLSEIKRTILHEIAHYKSVTYHKAFGHGVVFRREFEEMLEKYGITEEDSGHAPKVKPKYHMICTTDKTVKSYKKYYRKPSAKGYAKVARSFLKGKREETKGKLAIISHDEYLDRITSEVVADYLKEKV